MPRYDDDRPRRRGFRCPYCEEAGPPSTRTKVAAAGWVVLSVSAVTLLVLGLCTFFLTWLALPLCFLALLIREDYHVCRGCGVKLA